MLQFKKVHILEFLLILLNVSFATSTSKELTTTSYCGSLRIQAPFFLKNSSFSSPLNHLLLCKSQKLYLRTSLGLFQISSIDYSSKLLTVSHSFCSPTSHFISPISLTAGLPPPPKPNSLVLFNCSSQAHLVSPVFHNCTYFHTCGGSISSKLHPKELPKGSSSCLVVEDVGKLDLDFHPKEMNCTHYRRMYRKLSVDDSKIDGFELGTRISFDVPDHVPNPCDECKKPRENCGIGLKCICHPKECKDKVISLGAIQNPFGDILVWFLSFIMVMHVFKT